MVSKSFDFPAGAYVIFDTCSILSNVEFVKRMCEQRNPYSPVITSGVYNEMRGMRDDRKQLRGEIARELFPLIDSQRKNRLMYLKSELEASPIPNMSPVDWNLIQICERGQLRGSSIIVTNDDLLISVAENRGIPTRQIRTNPS